MKRNYSVFILTILALCLLIPGVASAIGVEGAVGYWMQTPSGDVAYEPVAAVDTLDIKDDFNLDTKSRPYARIKLDLPMFLPNVYLMATPMKFDGSGNKSFSFGGETFSGSFEAELQLDQYDIGLFYSIPFLNTATIGKLNADIGLNVKIIDFEARVSGSSGSGSGEESKALTIPLPMIYAGLQLKPIKALSIEVEARGIAYSGNHFYDIIGRVKVLPFGPLFISGGYRLQNITIEEGGIEANLNFNGPFLEVGAEI